MTTTNPTSNIGASAAGIVDSAANSADQAIRSSQRVANQTLDQISEGVDAVRAQAAPALNRLATDAEQFTRRSVDKVREGSQQLREQALRASDKTLIFIKDEPVKAVLIAAAVGAVLMALATLVGRAGPRG